MVADDGLDHAPVCLNLHCGMLYLDCAPVMKNCSCFVDDNPAVTCVVCVDDYLKHDPESMKIQTCSACGERHMPLGAAHQ